MGLYFRNGRNENIFVAYAYASPGCPDGGDWSKKGWWGIAPGQTAKVRSGWVGGSKFFYYAEAQDRSPVWSGEFFTHLPNNAFDWCWNTASSNGRTLGLRKIVVGIQFQDHTVNLV